MENATREKYEEFCKALAESYGVPSTSKKFAVTEPKSHQLNDAILHKTDFLKKISVIPKKDIVGQVDTLVIPSSVASRTDTSGSAKRAPQKAAGPSGREYRMHKTDFDVAIPYTVLDTWASYDDFQARYMNQIFERIGLDRIMIGFNGVSVAADTDRDTYPLLQDVNEGWLHRLKTDNPSMFLTEVVGASGEINIGSTGDYKNVDHLVSDLYLGIGTQHRTGNEIAVIGEGLVAYDTNKVYSIHGEDPLQKSHIKLLGKSYGGLTSISVPYFPSNGVMITDLKNLILYYQKSGVRRHTKDEPESDQVADYISSNEDYEIANLDGIAAIEAANVQFV